MDPLSRLPPELVAHTCDYLPHADLHAVGHVSQYISACSRPVHYDQFMTERSHLYTPYSLATLFKISQHKPMRTRLRPLAILWPSKRYCYADTHFRSDPEEIPWSHVLRGLAGSGEELREYRQLDVDDPLSDALRGFAASGTVLSLTLGGIVNEHHPKRVYGRKKIRDMLPKDSRSWENTHFDECSAKRAMMIVATAQRPLGGWDLGKIYSSFFDSLEPTAKLLSPLGTFDKPLSYLRKLAIPLTRDLILSECGVEPLKELLRLSPTLTDLCLESDPDQREFDSDQALAQISSWLAPTRLRMLTLAMSFYSTATLKRFLVDRRPSLKQLRLLQIGLDEDEEWSDFFLWAADKAELQYLELEELMQGGFWMADTPQRKVNHVPRYPSDGAYETVPVKHIFDTP